MDLENELEDYGSEVSEDEDAPYEDDTKKHSKMLLAMAEMNDGPKKPRVEQRTEPSLEVSEFNLASENEKGVRLYQLLGSLHNTNAHSQLKKQLIRVQRGKKKLDVPLHKHEAEKIQRTIAYNKNRKDISQWDDVVKANRKAEHLSFPLNQPKLGLQTTEQFVKRFKPSTPLEQEVYKLLNGSVHAERMDKPLTKAEEEVLSAMSLEEAQARRSELQKSRALMSYFESKCKRQKKIKSKKYRRIQRKSKAKEETKRLEELMRTNPEEAVEQMSRMERIRAQERVTLRHRNTGKWAQEAIRFAKFNEETKHKLSDQLQKSRELTEKIAKAIESEEEESAQPEKTKPVLSLSDINNPWFGGEGKNDGPHGDEVEEQGPKEGNKYCLPEAVSAVRDEGGEEGEPEEVEEDDEIDAELARIKEKRKLKENLSSGEEIIRLDGGEEKKPNIRKRKNITDLKKILERRKVTESKTDEEEEEESEEEEMNDFMDDLKSLEKRDDVEENDEEVLSYQEGLLSEDVTRRQDLKSLNKNWNDDLDAGKPQNTTEPQGNLDSKKKSRKKKSQNTKADSKVDPSQVFTLEPKNVMTLAPTMVVDEEEGDLTSDQHLMNIQEAFADDDVIGEFMAEKEAKIEKDKPRAVDLSLPGWGDWGGTGVKMSKKKKKRFIIPPKPAPTRKDSNLHHVIINEDRDKKLAIHQVNSLPFPYATTEQFERSIRAPVGSTWNTPSSVQKLTMPKVSTKMGTIIEPIHEAEAFKKKHKGGQMKRPAPDIAFDSETSQKKRRRGKGKKK